MSKKLVVSDGTRERELQLVGTLVVGRDPACDITYDDALLSRRHAEFVAAGDKVTVRDLGSRNGVFVNGSKIAERSLRSGDVVQIGPVRARYIADTVPVSTAPDEVDVDHTAVLRRGTSTERPQAAAASAIDLAETPAILRSASRVPAEDDQDRTRLIPGPPAVQTADAAAQPAPAPVAAGDDEERTQFLRSPAAGSSQSAARAPQPDVRPGGPSPTPSPTPSPAPSPTPSPAPSPTPSPAPSLTPSLTPSPTPQEDSSISSYVFVHALTLAAIVLIAAAVPLFVWRGSVVGSDPAGESALVWLALPVVVALVAAYGISTRITRRFVHALAAVERNQR